MKGLNIGRKETEETIAGSRAGRAQRFASVDELFVDRGYLNATTITGALWRGL